MKDGFTVWSEEAPPPGVLLKIYCAVKRCIYEKLYTREEVEAWAERDSFPDDPVDWSMVGWKLTGIAKMQLEGA